MKPVNLNEARFGDAFLDQKGNRLIYNEKKRGYHELLEEKSHRLMPYTDDGWFRWYFDGFSGFKESVLTRTIPAEKRSPLTTRIVHADDDKGLVEIHRAYKKAYAKLIKEIEKVV